MAALLGMMMALAAQPPVAMDPALTPANLTDLLAEPCTGWGLGDPIGRKSATIMLYGYVHGQLEAGAAACDDGHRTTFCGRVAARDVDLARVLPGEFDRSIERACAAHPDWTMRDVAKDILADPRLGYAAAHADTKTDKH